MSPYTLQIEEAVTRQLGHLRASIRASIEKHLREIVHGENERPIDHRAPTAMGPPLRFYVYDSYRVSYRVDPHTRSVVVFKVRSDPG